MSAAAGTLTIKSALVADDDRDLLITLVRSLQKRGIDAEGVHNADEAIAMALRRSFSLYVVDLKLGDDSGVELVRQLSQLDPSGIIVVVTGYGSIATALAATRNGAHNYITKPADADDILAAAASPFESANEGRRTAAEKPFGASSLARAEWEHIQRVLADCDGNISRAADKLGIHRRSLQRKLQRPPSD